MRKVLIIGPQFHYFNQSVAKAFRSHGCETRILAYDNPIHPYDWANRVRYRLAKDKTALKRHSRICFRQEAEKAFVEFEPELVFVMNGDMLLPETLLRWRGKLANDGARPEKPAKVALWFFDSFTHIPLCEDNIPVVDAVFCYEQTDLPLIAERFGVEAQFLPQAVDESLYHPLDVSGESLDIVFAGDIFHSEKRKEILQAVVTRYADLKMRFWGEYKPWYKNPLQWLLRERRDIYMNRNASAEQLNADYNRARIVLNVHIEQQKNGANPKVYEIAASGAYQICDANPYVEQLFPHGEVGMYDIDETKKGKERFAELFKRIDYALDYDMSKQAAAARKAVVSNHTFEKRIEQVLRTLY